MESTKNKLTIPIIFLSIYIIFTFTPVLYTYFPIFGTIKLVLIAGIGLLISYLLHTREYNNLNAWRNPIFKTWSAILFIMILGLIVSPDRGLTLSIIQTVVKYFVVLAIMVKIIDSEHRLDFLIKIFSLCGFVMAVSTIFNYFFSGITFQDSIRGSAIESGIFADPNDLALFLNVTLPFVFYFYYKFSKGLLFLFAIVIVEIAVILTYSRGGFLGSCAVLLSITYFRKAERGGIISLLLVGFIFFVAFAPMQYKERLTTILVESKIDAKTGKYPGRMQAWVELLPVGMHSPVIGVGSGCSWYLSGSRDNSDWHAIHNTFLQVFLETGLLGFWCYLLFYLIPFRHYCKVKPQISETETNSYINRYQFILVSLIAFATTAFFIPQAYSPILFLLSGITLVQYELAETAINVLGHKTDTELT